MHKSKNYLCISWLSCQIIALVTKITKWILKMVKVGPAHARFHALFLLKNHWFCCCCCCWLLKSAKAASSSLHVNNCLIYSFTHRGYSVPQKKGFWSSPAGNPGRNTNKTIVKGYRDWIDDYLVLLALALKFQSPIWKVPLMDVGAL